MRRDSTRRDGELRGEWNSISAAHNERAQAIEWERGFGFRYLRALRQPVIRLREREREERKKESTLQYISQRARVSSLSLGPTFQNIQHSYFESTNLLAATAPVERREYRFRNSFVRLSASGATVINSIAFSVSRSENSLGTRTRTQGTSVILSGSN